MADLDLAERRKAAFVTLADIVRAWREQGRGTTSAGVKPPFVEAMDGQDERSLGFTSWREFLDAAVGEGYVRTEQLPSRHTVILLPDEDVVSVRASMARTASSSRGAAAADVRFKPQVWAAFIEWHEDHRRLWDTASGRALVYPVDEDGRPAWETQTERFTPIEAVTFETQRGWMREWAGTQPPADRDALLATLTPEAPLRSFRQELDARGLALAWRAELHARVREHASSWAAEHGVPFHELILRQHPPAARTRAPARPASSTHRVPDAASPHQDAPALDDCERLRRLVHRAVDRMSYAELAAIPIRAEHVLDELR
ncbi:hypothetical protein [Actinomadura flavalba]|uniref:hypothetical protein n=1 Tax=Actinomadura flavalba TaxID=1120938 RepID=UPI000381ECA7|nr:hypothetical protein [Actinomadura flavalba]